MDAVIDGNYTIAQTLSAIRYEECLGYELTALSHGAGKVATPAGDGPANYATFVDLSPPGTQSKALDLVVITDPAATASLIATKLAQGWGLIVVAKIYVQGTLTSVAAFRKLQTHNP